MTLIHKMKAHQFCLKICSPPQSDDWILRVMKNIIITFIISYWVLHCSLDIFFNLSMKARC